MGTRTKKEKDDQYIQERNRGIVVTVHLVHIAHSKTEGRLNHFPRLVQIEKQSKKTKKSNSFFFVF